MNNFTFQIKVNGKAQTANLQFASKQELRRYHRSLSSTVPQCSQAVRDAVEFTRLAAKRWRYYSGAGEAAECLSELRQASVQHKHSEVAFILVATTRRESREPPVGLAYCRRTWGHHPALDFPALHPRALDAKQEVAGVGGGSLHGLVRLAKTLRIRRTWGEATVHSAPFYERLLALAPILDLFVIESREMKIIQSRQAKISR